MARRPLRLAVALILLGAVVGAAGARGPGIARHVEARSGLVRTVVISRAHAAAPTTAPSPVLRRRLASLVRGLRRPGAGSRRIVHAPAVNVPSVPSQSCPVGGSGCSLHPCVLFAGATAIVLRLPTAVLRSRPGPARRGARRPTVVAVAPIAHRNGGRRGLRAAGCRRLRAGALPTS